MWSKGANLTEYPQRGFDGDRIESQGRIKRGWCTVEIPTTMSVEFRPNTANALFLDSPSPTLPVPPHIPELFPMSVPTSPQLFVICLQPLPLVGAHISPVPSSSPPASPPTTLTHLEKQAIKACHANNRIQSESESLGEDDGKIVDEVVDEKVGEVQGPINMSEPWIEGPKSAKVSLTSA
jgi:hypothetical protein